MIDELIKNINAEIGILREISGYVRRIESANQSEKQLLEKAVLSLKESLKLINTSIPHAVKEISLSKKLPRNPSSKKLPVLQKVEVERHNQKVDVVLKTEDKEKFMKELSISEKYIRKLHKRSEEIEEEYKGKGSRRYLKWANKFYLNKARNAVDEGKYKSLSVGLRRANIDILFQSYISMMYFTLMLSIIASFFIFVGLIFFEVGIGWPFISFYDGSYLERVMQIFWIPIAIPILVFSALYLYPSSEQKSLAIKIDQELPFAVIHMSAISGSGIAPSEIFKIIGLSNEYPALRKEIRKILNQINLYGYDLITALNNTAKTSPSDGLSELFSGLSQTITSGADLSDFLEKRAESLLLGYRLEREKYTKVVETFLDIYISVVIAAPMILLLLLIMMAVSGIQVGFSSFQLSIVSVLGIAILNAFFLVFLQIKQPTY